MNKLNEIEYDDFFSKRTMDSLKGKSGESLRNMLGNKSLMQTMMRSSTLVREIINAEKDYIRDLEDIATNMASDVYPIIDYAGIQIDARIVDMSQIKVNKPQGKEDSDCPSCVSVDQIPDSVLAKRRIINGITQGASVRGAFAYMLFKEYIEVLDERLIDKYNEILKLSFGIYDSEEAIAMLLSMMAQGSNMPGGSSEMVYNKDEDTFIIKARAICFPMLFHEIVKGLYEIVGTEGFGSDKEKNKSIVDKIDKLDNEPRDFQYGKFIYDALNDLFIEFGNDDLRTRELLFTEIYRLEDAEFITFIENVIHGELTPEQKRWVKDTLYDIKIDLRKDDTNLPDLD
jgi:hypothetical protein